MSVREDEQALEALRDAIVGPERARLDALRARVEDPHWRRHEVREAVQHLLEADPTSITEHLVPVIFPILRSALVAQLRTYIRGLETVLEQTFTLEWLRWRWQSWRTGVPVHEIALRDGFLAHVEQLLLLHTESGLAVAQAARSGADEAQDPDLVSAMVSAVGSFVHDAFVPRDGGDAAELERVEFGERELWLARGRWLTLVAAVRGVGTPRLRARLLEAIARVEREHRSTIATFDGSVDLRPVLDPFLATYLDAERRPPRRWARWSLAAAALAVVLLVGVAWGRSLFERKRLEAWSTRLHDQPGVVVTDERWTGSVLRLEALRDPDARVPNEKPSRIEVRWLPFLSLEPEVVRARALRRLEPPDGVRLELRAGSELVLAGPAPTSWIRRARATAPDMPGVTAVDLTGLHDPVRGELEALLDELETLRVTFPKGASQTDDLGPLDRIRDLLGGADARARRLGVEVRLGAIGAADPSGPAALNRKLSERRAAWLADAVRALDLDRVRVVAVEGRADDGSDRTAHLDVLEVVGARKGARP